MDYQDNYTQFLRDLDSVKNKEIYAKITVLTFNELPVETIEGRVTGGSINIDGASAIRRTCSLTISAQDFSYNEYYWGLKSKFKLEIGVKNTINSNMPNIIWFNQGIYILTSFNTSINTNSYSISISGKDKMCLLNGEVGGSLESPVDFGTIEEKNRNGVTTIKKIPIFDIIRNAVHTYAGEPYHNIIINDLETYGLELLEYRYDVPMYLYRASGDTWEAESQFYNMIIENDYLKLYLNSNGTNEVKLKDLTSTHLDVLVNSLDGESHQFNEVYVKTGNSYTPYRFAKVEYGQTAGYKMTDLTFPGSLIANTGESITSVLDKIKNVLVEFEYFYDLDGRFVFQKKKSFIATMWSPLNENGLKEQSMQQSLALATSNSYIFSDNQLITSIANNPNLLNLRNDYSIWGERTGISGANIPIHLRYAIDKKPISYTQIDTSDQAAQDQITAYNLKYNTTLAGHESPQTFVVSSACDWREIIYQMALDYYKFNFLDDFEIRVANANPEYFNGQTGYERYYIDLEGFWRQLYYPSLDIKIKETEAEISRIQQLLRTLADELQELRDKIGSGILGSLLQALINLLRSREKEEKELQTELKTLEERLKEYRKELELYYYFDLDEEGNVLYDYQNPGNGQGPDPKVFWRRDVFEHPEMLNFWFDFLDTEGQLQQYNVKNIGSRSKTVNETSIKSIYFRETPAVIFTDNINTQFKPSGYRFLQIPEKQIDDMFSLSSQGKSAKNRLDELIYAHGYCIETANIVTLPIYHLDVNTRIYINDNESGITGDYIVDKITLPLTYNGTMSMSATKAAENVLK